MQPNRTRVRADRAGFRPGALRAGSVRFQPANRAAIQALLVVCTLHMVLCMGTTCDYYCNATNGLLLAMLLILLGCFVAPVLFHIHAPQQLARWPVNAIVD